MRCNGSKSSRTRTAGWYIVAEQTLDIQALKAVVEESKRPHREARGGVGD